MEVQAVAPTGKTPPAKGIVFKLILLALHLMVMMVVQALSKVAPLIGMPEVEVVRPQREVPQLLEPLVMVVPVKHLQYLEHLHITVQVAVAELMVHLGHRDRAEQVVAVQGHLPDKVAMGQPMGQAAVVVARLMAVVVQGIRALLY